MCITQLKAEITWNAIKRREFQDAVITSGNFLPWRKRLHRMHWKSSQSIGRVCSSKKEVIVQNCFQMASTLYAHFLVSSVARVVDWVAPCWVTFLRADSRVHILACLNWSLMRCRLHRFYFILLFSVRENWMELSLKPRRCEIEPTTGSLETMYWMQWKNSFKSRSFMCDQFSSQQKVRLKNVCYFTCTRVFSKV